MYVCAYVWKYHIFVYILSNYFYQLCLNWWNQGLFCFSNFILLIFQILLNMYCFYKKRKNILGSFNLGIAEISYYQKLKLWYLYFTFRSNYIIKFSSFLFPLLHSPNLLVTEDCLGKQSDRRLLWLPFMGIQGGICGNKSGTQSECQVMLREALTQIYYQAQVQT